MLRKLEDLEGCTLRATDGEIGTVDDFYFDDARWAIRYLVAETGSWLSSRRMLISPMSIGAPPGDDRVLGLTITQEQVKNSPDIDTDKPVSRQHELDYLGYYGYPTYWDSVGLWGAGAMPGLAIDPGMVATGPAPGAADADAEETDLSGRRTIDDALARRHEHDDPHLRSCDEVVGYDLKASDGEIGHVKGFLVDDRDWAIRYLVVDTSRWLFGHLVLIAPPWIERVSWEERQVVVSMSSEAIKAAPAWDGTTLPDRAQETAIYGHYDRPGYW